MGLSEQFKLLRFRWIYVHIRFDEHLSEKMKQDIYYDRVPGQFVLSAVADSRSLNIADVFVINAHQAETFGWCQLSDSEFLALKFGR